MFSQFVFTTPDIFSAEILNAQDDTSADSNSEGNLSKRIGPDGKPLGLSGGGQKIDDKHKGKKGTIILEFYRTREFERPMRSFRHIHQKTYEQHFISDSSKKSFNESLTIKEGNTFCLPPKN